MQVLIFLASWISIALGVAIDNLDINLYNDPFVDPTLDPGVHDTDLFEDASKSDLSLFTDSSNNQWDSLPNSDTDLSYIDGMDWDSDSWLTITTGIRIPCLIPRLTFLIPPGLMKVCLFSFFSFFFFFFFFLEKLTLLTSISYEADSSLLIASENGCDATASSDDFQPFGKVRRQNSCQLPPVGQAEKPRKPSNSQEPNDPSILMPYIEVVKRAFPDDYDACPPSGFVLSNIPVCFHDKYINERMIPTPPFGYRLIDVRPGACMHDF